MKKVKSYAVIGLGVFGRSVAKSLMEDGMEVLVVDNNKEVVNEMASEVTYALQVDVTNENALKNIGLDRMDGVIIAIGEDLKATVMATIICKELGIPKVIAKAKTDLERRILERVGADQVVIPELETGYRLAKNMADNFVDFFQLSNGLTVAEISPKKEWVGKSLRDLNFRRAYNLNIISIQSSGESSGNGYPDPDRKIREDDTIILSGKAEDVERI